MTTPSTPHILAIDVGTSALKAVVYSEKGRLIAMATGRYRYRAPRPGWAEMEVEHWWTALLKTLANLQAEVGTLSEIRVLALTGQMHTPVLLDENGAVLEPTILWLDRRAEKEARELREQFQLPPYQINATYTLPKLLWLRRHRPQVLARTRHLLWPKDYLRYRLTGRILSEINEAAGAALLNWESRTWATNRLAVTGLEPTVLPPLADPSADAGPLLPSVARQLGLSPRTKVIVGAGDVIALMGAALPQQGRLTCSLGSSGMFSLLLEDSQTIHDPEQRLYVYPFLPYRFLNGVSSTSGAALTWAWRSLYAPDTSLELVLQSAQEIPTGAEGLLFLPFLAGARSPYWNDRLRGGFWGLSLSHDRRHMVRAVLEGVAFSIRQLLEIYEELAPPVHELALAGGATTVPGWAQIIADICQRPVSIFSGQETVTRPLYAYARQALDPTIPFSQALTNTFSTPPAQCFPRPDSIPIYEPLYQHYRQMADFAAKIA
ncbi:MAG: hypothetical protein GXP38_17875 [Chloroflexi bacterium]|nr:hypothetical protein [Chloroflexota bacterium]